MLLVGIVVAPQLVKKRESRWVSSRVLKEFAAKNISKLMMQAAKTKTTKTTANYNTKTAKTKAARKLLWVSAAEVLVWRGSCTATQHIYWQFGWHWHWFYCCWNFYAKNQLVAATHSMCPNFPESLCGANTSLWLPEKLGTCDINSAVMYNSRSIKGYATAGYEYALYAGVCEMPDFCFYLQLTFILWFIFSKSFLFRFQLLI